MTTSPAVIYLDNNATTAMDPRVADEMMRWYQAGPINPASPHRLGQRARVAMDDAIELIGQCLRCDLGHPGGPRLIITSGGTESNNLALSGIAIDGPLLVSSIEHASVLAMAKKLAAEGRRVRTLDVDQNGLVKIERLVEEIESVTPPSMVAVMSANNETGVVQPIGKIARLCQQHSIHLHVDATQSIGKFETRDDPMGLGLDGDLASSGITSLTFAAHKFHGPTGVGGLWIAGGVQVEAMMRGGEQQLDTRPGTEALPLVVGMAEAMRLAVESADESVRLMKGLRDHLESQIVKAIPSCHVHSQSVPRLPNTTCIAFPGIDRQSLLMALDMKAVACSSTSACSSGSSPPSHVLTAMGASEEQLRSTLRFAVSRLTKSSEIKLSTEHILICCNNLR
ncbi:MAG: cysteine desulfurase family protein [Planctomycetota bacterium]